MSFKTALDSFDVALDLAKENGDTPMEHLLAGLVDLTKALRADANATKSALSAIESKVRSLH